MLIKPIGNRAPRCADIWCLANSHSLRSQSPHDRGADGPRFGSTSVHIQSIFLPGSRDVENEMGHPSPKTGSAPPDSLVECARRPTRRSMDLPAAPTTETPNAFQCLLQMEGVLQSVNRLPWEPATRVRTRRLWSVPAVGDGAPVYCGRIRDDPKGKSEDTDDLGADQRTTVSFRVWVFPPASNRMKYMPGASEDTDIRSACRPASRRPATSVVTRRPRRS